MTAWRVLTTAAKLVVLPLLQLPAIGRLLTGRRGVPREGIAITHGRSDRQFAAFTLGLTVLEASVVGLLFRSFAVMRYIDAVQWWGVGLILGMLATATVYPHVVSPLGLAVRHHGRRYDIPREQIASVVWQAHKETPGDDALFLGDQHGTQLAIALAEPYQVPGTQRMVKRVLIAADDPDSAARLEGALRRR